MQEWLDAAVADHLDPAEGDLPLHAVLAGSWDHQGRGKAHSPSEDYVSVMLVRE
jgi:hypothetical protein